ncbi:MAG: hypothetical protein HQK51_10420 [Oligoflexia bacterium]|nr:hypothetical protein [Oligoflexia bacterium]
MKKLNLLFALAISVFGFKSFADEIVFDHAIKLNTVDLDKYVSGDEINVSDLLKDKKLPSGGIIEISPDNGPRFLLMKDRGGNIKIKMDEFGDFRAKLYEYASPSSNGGRGGNN